MFSELTVIDASSVLAGPSVGTFFAELGAEVIKVESPRGDVTQNWRTAGESLEGWSAYYSSVNYGKTLQNLNLKSDEGRKKLLDLIAKADVLITNFKSSDYERFGLEESIVFSKNPKLIWGRIKGFERDEDRLAFDVVLQAETGFMSMNGQPGSLPTKMPVALMDVLAAHQLKEGILCGLLERERTALGGKVEVSLEAAAISSLVNQASNFLMNGVVAKPMGSRHPNIAPYGDLFTCKDGVQVVTAVGSDAQFASFCELIELPISGNWKSNPLRVGNRESLVEAISEKLAKWNHDSLLKQAKERGIPMGAVKDLKRVFESSVAQSLVLEEQVAQKSEEGQNTRRVAQKAFHFTPYQRH